MTGRKEHTTNMPALVKGKIFPNTLAENAKISEEFAGIANKISDEALDIFLEITQIPHISGHTDQISRYVKAQLESAGIPYHTDQASKTLYADIPPSASHTQNKKLILQAHMDMVAAASEKFKDYNPATTVVQTVFDAATGAVSSKDQLTNIGADDGQGVSAMISLAKNHTLFDHPAIRLLFTIDEEIGMLGAKKLIPSVLDADYLIGLDGGRVGEVFVTSPGSVSGAFTKQYTTSQLTAQEAAISIKIDNLKGGHTGLSVHEPKLHGSHYLLEALQRLSRNAINFRLSKISCGSSKNSFPTNIFCQIFVPKNQLEQAKNTLDKHLHKAQASFASEKAAKILVKCSVDTVNLPKALSANDSKTLVETLLKVPDGVLQMSEVDKDVPSASCAMGKLHLEDSKLESIVMLRSCNDKDIQKYIKEFPEVASHASMKFILGSSYYGVPYDPNNELIQTMLEAFEQVCGFKGALNSIHGGLEISWFRNKRPSLTTISIGADVQDEHMVTETFYTKSYAAHIASILYVLKNFS